MAIFNKVDEDQKIVYTRCTGLMTIEDFTDYITRVWGDFTHYGYNELFDLVDGDWSEFEFGFLLEIAREAARLKTIDYDSKLAWVLQDGKQKELVDFYKTAKALLPVQSRSLKAFYSRDEAMKWLTE